VRLDCVERLQELLSRGAQLVEVLPEDEYREEHLPGAINIPLSSWTPGARRGWKRAGPSSPTAGTLFET
jgi:rhodanese-related sulfurtransferase